MCKKLRTRVRYYKLHPLGCRGDRTGGAGGATASPIFLDIDGTVVFSTHNISRLKEGTAPEIH